MLKKLALISLLAIVALGTTGCISFNTNKTTEASNLGGVFRSDDRFDTWKSASALMTPAGTAGSINAMDVSVMRMDPNDDQAIYIGAGTNGLLYTLNLGAGWNKVTTLPAGNVGDIAVEAKNKCTIYAAVGSKIYKSEDCTRTWASTWYSDSETNPITSLAADWYDPKVLFAGLNNGNVIKSEDHGVSWRVLGNFKRKVSKIVIDPNDSRVVYIGVELDGLYKSTDKGTTWNSLGAAMKDFSQAKTYFDFDVSKSAKDEIIYASAHGLLRSLDGGQTWAEVKLLTLPGKEKIYSLVIDPTNANAVYYSTDTALYKTLDGGNTWINKKMPTTRAADTLLVHPTKPNILFMGVRTVQQK